MAEPMSIESNLALLNIKVAKLEEKVKALEKREKARTGHVTGLFGVGGGRE